jgi:hypothetical protein
MGFLDNKEEILNIILTEHGKNLLDEGKFVPVFYAFFDDEVDYQDQAEEDA